IAFLLWRAWRERRPRLVGHAALAGALALALGGWWYARNLALFGDALGWAPMLHAIGPMQRPQPLNAVQAAAVLLQQRATALGVFGWNNLRLLPWVYLAGDAAALLALAGLAAGLVHSCRKALAACPSEERSDAKSRHQALPINKRGRFFASLRMTEVWILPLWIVVFGASLVRWAAFNTDAAQWRLLMPAFPAIAVLLVLGLYRLILAWVVLVPASLAGLSVASLLFVIRPAYTPDPPYTGPIQHPLNVRFGNALELAGYDDPAPRSLPRGQPVTITLYWRALAPISEDDIVDLAALDASGQAGWKESTWPEEGRAPTTGWRVGQVVRDLHVLEDATLAPGVWNLQLDVYRPVEGAPRLPIDATGDTTVDVGRFLVNPPQTAASSAAPDAAFEGNLALLSHRQLRSGGDLQVGLRWASTGSIDRDYTVFVHLLDSKGKLLAQDDSQPGGDRFPTSLLSAETTIDDPHVLNISGVAAGNYQIEVGLYDARTGQRLRLRNSPADAFTWDVQLAK
ncbi:MAG TPA: hypothetical protein VKU60_15935, partial [Chloroflexota bacterium]|nr:hypothetical protein [Chloroflexota bacterium]